MPGDATRVEHRKRLRLPGYDYSSAGAYFVTICAAGRGSIFGEVIDAKVQLNVLGRCVEEAIAAIPGHHDVVIDASIVMPDHVHAILVLGVGTRAPTLS